GERAFEAQPFNQMGGAICPLGVFFCGDMVFAKNLAHYSSKDRNTRLPSVFPNTGRGSWVWQGRLFQILPLAHALAPHFPKRRRLIYHPADALGHEPPQPAARAATTRSVRIVIKRANTGGCIVAALARPRKSVAPLVYVHYSLTLLINLRSSSIVFPVRKSWKESRIAYNTR